jgi:hypothetical protein
VVEYELRHAFQEQRLLASDLQEDPILADLPILGSAQGTVFRVSPDLVERLAERVERHLEVISKNGEISERFPIDGATYRSILDGLAARNLYFPPELVSNYLLALQTKRLVLLTGISGTGKTKLAMAVADHFRPVVRVSRAVDPPENAVEIEVQPYMLKYRRFMLPVALTSQLRLPAEPYAKPQIRIQYPSGSQDLTIWRDQDPGRNVTALLFRGEFRQWFDQNVELGQRILLEPVEPDDDDQPHGLRLTLPSVEPREVTLDNLAVVAVQPDWTDKRGLLGYYNPITRSYSVTPFLDLLLRATEEVDRARSESRAPAPFFVVLDEMNLARVEQYFADFLSCLESGEPLHLHDDADIASSESAERPIPTELAVPPNVYFTGTVNIDETTHMFSPKVLDRAFTLEFNAVYLSRLGRDAPSSTEIDAEPLALHGLTGPLRQPAPLGGADWAAFVRHCNGEMRDCLLDLHALLESFNRHFGYRVALEVARFVNLAAEQTGGGDDTLWSAFDLAVLQKVLPKFHGTQAELAQPIEALFTFAVTGHPPASENDIRSPAWKVEEGTLRNGASPDEEPFLPRMAAKTWRMSERLRRQGFASFIE